MKSRWTTYLLAAAVAAVWGVVAWRLLAPRKPDVPVARRTAASLPAPVSVAETLRLNYPDPFLKAAPKAQPPPRPVVRPLLPVRKAAPHPERTKMVHLATVSAGGSTLHILKIGQEQYELHAGDSAAGFRLVGADRDSLYLDREGIACGVKRCE